MQSWIVGHELIIRDLGLPGFFASNYHNSQFQVTIICHFEISVLDKQGRWKDRMSIMTCPNTVQQDMYLSY
jgi:hypothetical protein